MKYKRIKRMLSAVALSIAVMSSAMASSAVAAEGDAGTVTPRHVHQFFESAPDNIYYSANSTYHYRSYGTLKWCITCDYEQWNELALYYEEHDMGGAAESPNRYRCLQCGYEE